MYVSSGKSLKNVSVPSVVSMKQADAEKLLKEKKLISVVEEVNYSKNSGYEYAPIGYVIKQEPSGDTSIVEGSTIKIYVNKGFSANVTVTLPKRSEFKLEQYYISLWNDTEMLSEKSIDATKLSKYTFENITSSRDIGTYTIQIRALSGDAGKDYQKIKIDYKDGTFEVISNSEEYKKWVSDSDNPNNNTGTTGGNNTNKSNTNNR